VLHEALQVEIGQLDVILLQVQQLLELVVWVDLLLVLGILQVVLLDVDVELPSHLGPRKL